MTISALDVAWFFVVRGDGDPSITQLKLQKLVYYTQGFHLARFDEPLFYEVIEAWDYGPVVPALRQLHRDRGADTILPSESPFGQIPVSQNTVNFLDDVFRRYNRYSCGELIDMTHAETPWLDTYKNSRKSISLESIRDYFKSLILDNSCNTDSNYSQHSDEPITTVFLKGGTSKRIKLADLDAFIARSGVLIEPRKLTRRGKRRSPEKCA